MPDSKFKLSIDAFSNQIEKFFKYIRDIQPLIIFMALLIALYAILSKLDKPTNLDLPFYETLNYILFFMQSSYIIIGFYWFWKKENKENKFRNNFFIAGFLTVFGIILSGTSLWVYSLYMPDVIIPQVIQIIILYGPSVLPFFFFFINLLSFYFEIEFSYRKQFVSKSSKENKEENPVNPL